LTKRSKIYQNGKQNL